MYMAVGKLSLVDWDMLTWSLGCTGFFAPSGVPASWQQRLETTSLTFMLNWVPLPVIQTRSGNMASCLCSRISSHTAQIMAMASPGSRPCPALARAAAFLSTA